MLNILVVYCMKAIENSFDEDKYVLNACNYSLQQNKFLASVGWSIFCQRCLMFWDDKVGMPLLVNDCCCLYQLSISPFVHCSCMWRAGRHNFFRKWTVPRVEIGYNRMCGQKPPNKCWRVRFKALGAHNETRRSHPRFHSHHEATVANIVNTRDSVVHKHQRTNTARSQSGWRDRYLDISERKE